MFSAFSITSRRFSIARELLSGSGVGVIPDAEEFTVVEQFPVEQLPVEQLPVAQLPDAQPNPHAPPHGEQPQALLPYPYE